MFHRTDRNRSTFHCEILDELHNKYNTNHTSIVENMYLKQSKHIRKRDIIFPSTGTVDGYIQECTKSEANSQVAENRKTECCIRQTEKNNVNND